jgi:hypothetical protein
VEEDSERWYAGHQRIEGISMALMVVAASISSAPGLKAEIIQGLQVCVDRERRRQAHPALLGEIDRLLKLIETSA